MQFIINISACVRRLAPSAMIVTRTYKTSLVMQRDREQSRIAWDPLQVFNYQAHHKYAVIILNRPILWNHASVFRMWENAQITITVDGGTHRWLKYLEEEGIDVTDGEHNRFIPNFITGDMDSCSPLVIEKLKTLGATVVETPDQDLTDYTKTLVKLGQHMKMENICLNSIYVMAETSGRFDHIMGNINTLYKSEKYTGNTKVINIASNSLTWILRPGFHTISIPKVLVQKGEWCGLLPIGSPVKHITTTGLKWNLNDDAMQFGGLVSSSNSYSDCSEVTIDTDTSLIWTMGIESLIEDLRNGDDICLNSKRKSDELIRV